MRNFHSLILVLAVAALVAVVASPADAAKPKKKSTIVAFVGSYSGQASTLINGNTVTITANGSGRGTLIGSGALKANGTGDSSQQPCVPFGGTGSITGVGGVLNFSATPTTSTSCGDEGGHNFTVKAFLTITSATGKLAKKKGTLRAIGTYSRDDGTFTVKLTGALK